MNVVQARNIRSPSGVGYGRNPKVFMKPGDVVEVEVKEIGILRNRVET